ncbi:MAG TPA: hypothetical protein VHJ82_04535 [Actinomycetota bacterium]|nr:hypothetical protein [Actinomycetota bacterium]
MSIQVTDEAAVVLRRSLELAGIDAATGGVRLRVAKSLGGGLDVMVEFADVPGDDEEVEEERGIRLFVHPDLRRVVADPIVVLEPQHERVVVRSAAAP